MNSFNRWTYVNAAEVAGVEDEDLGYFSARRVWSFYLDLAAVDGRAVVPGDHQRAVEWQLGVGHAGRRRRLQRERRRLAGTDVRHGRLVEHAVERDRDAHAL